MLECALLPARWQWEIMIDFNGPLAPIKIIVERFRSWIRGPLHVRRHWKTFGRISSIFQVSTYYNLTVKFALWMWYKWRKYKNHLYTHELGCAFWVIILFILRAPLLKYVMPTQKPRGFNKIRSISSSILCTKCVNTVKELLTRAVMRENLMSQKIHLRVRLFHMHKTGNYPNFLLPFLRAKIITCVNDEPKTKSSFLEFEKIWRFIERSFLGNYAVTKKLAFWIFKNWFTSRISWSFKLFQHLSYNYLPLSTKKLEQLDPFL